MKSDFVRLLQTNRISNDYTNITANKKSAVACARVFLMAASVAKHEERSNKRCIPL